MTDEGQPRMIMPLVAFNGGEIVLKSMTGTLVWAKWLTALVWLVLGFCVIAWVMHLRAQATSSMRLAPAQVEQRQFPVPDFDAMVRAMNAGALPQQPSVQAAVPPATSRFQVRGVALANQGSVALISVDGQAAKPHTLGSEVVDGWVVRSVTSKAVRLGKSGDSSSIEISVPQPER